VPDFSLRCLPRSFAVTQLAQNVADQFLALHGIMYPYPVCLEIIWRKKLIGGRTSYPHTTPVKYAIIGFTQHPSNVARILLLRPHGISNAAKLIFPEHAKHGAFNFYIFGVSQEWESLSIPLSHRVHSKNAHLQRTVSYNPQENMMYRGILPQNP
jgi:hypothetical protein